MTTMEVNTEIWKPIFGFEGLYQVSNWGRVKSLGNDKSRKERILKPGKQTCGYLQVCLFKDGKVFRRYVHVLVGEAFIPNDDLFKTQINHRDEDKTNNCVENLEWVSCAENINFGSRTERMAKTNTNGKLSKAVLQLSLDGTFVKEWPSAMEIQRQLGFSIGNISHCCLGKYKQAYKFKWQYKYENR